jgi:hypothetical protein
MAGAGTAILKSSVMNKKARKSRQTAVWTPFTCGRLTQIRVIGEGRTGSKTARAPVAAAHDRSIAILLSLPRGPRRQQKKGERAMRSPFPSNERSQPDL